MKRLASGLVAIPLLAACGIFDVYHDGLVIESPTGALVVGDTIRMSILRWDGSAPSASEVSWTSSEGTVATVDDTGLVTGAGPGWVQIGARSAGFNARLFLWVWELAPPFVSVAVGGDHSCGLAEDGRAWCWGAARSGKLGVPLAHDFCIMRTARCSTGAVPVATEVRFASLALGSDHTCGLNDSGTAYCWGSNERGELGDGGTTSRWTPAPVAGEHVFRSLAAGGGTTCGITELNELLCWGWSAFGVPGTPAAPATTPVHVATEHLFTVVAPSGAHTCALTVAGAAWCWGRNGHGQLGVAHVDVTTEPQRAASAPPLVSLTVGSDYTCGLADDGTAHCWGRNHLGQLGDGTTEGRWEAAAVLGGHSFSMLAAGPSHACALDAGGRLYCWGRDEAAFGRGGEGSASSAEPLRGAPGLAFNSIAVGLGVSCAAADTGTTWCWGSNAFGSLGNGRSALRTVSTPVRVVRRTDLP